jgi:type IV pilus assembly protein PilO
MPAVRHQPGRIGAQLAVRAVPPGQVVVKEYYAELPISVRVTGRYHDMGLFAADIANLSRIVTLNNMTLTPVKDRDGVLTMECTAKTFRYLDQEEIAQQQSAAAKGAKKKVNVKNLQRVVLVLSFAVLAGCGSSSDG